MTLALIPVKSLATAKSRLAGALRPDERRALVSAMLEKVIAECVLCEGLDGIYVITPDREIAAIALARGAEPIAEAGESGLNGAVRAGLVLARASGAERALILPADIPFLNRSELRRLLDAAPGAASAAIVPCHKGEGTNALLLPSRIAFTPQFGEDSFRRHMRQLGERGLNARTLNLPGIAHDIDEPDDLPALRRPPVPWTLMAAPPRSADASCQPR